MNYDDWNEQIPAYALGALDAQEAAALEKQLAVNAALRASLEAYRAIVGDLPIAATPIVPPQQLKAVIMAQATGQRVGAAKPQLRIPERRPWFWFPRLVFATALCAILLLAAGWANTAVQLNQALASKQQVAQQLAQAAAANQQTAAELTSAQSALETLRAEQQALGAQLTVAQRNSAKSAADLAQRTSEVQQLTQQIQSTQQALIFLSADTVTSRSLRAVRTDIAAQGSMFMKPGQTNAVILVRNLPALDQTHSYQFWLADNRHQVNAGKLEVDQNGVGRLVINVSDSVDTFAQIMITVEQREAAATPSDKVVLQGQL